MSTSDLQALPRPVVRGYPSPPTNSGESHEHQINRLLCGGGPSIDASQYFGIDFTVTSPSQVTGIGGSIISDIRNPVPSLVQFFRLSTPFLFLVHHHS
jgi:hypothetical protein